jgi:predicted hydrolase (HD superfamily)
MSGALSREDAWAEFCAWTESPSLRRHVLAVEAAMRAYARRFGGDEELWGVTGLLHALPPRTAIRASRWPTSRP